MFLGSVCDKIHACSLQNFEPHPEPMSYISRPQRGVLAPLLAPRNGGKKQQQRRVVMITLVESRTSSDYSCGDRFQARSLIRCMRTPRQMGQMARSGYRGKLQNSFVAVVLRDVSIQHILDIFFRGNTAQLCRCELNKLPEPYAVGVFRRT